MLGRPRPPPIAVDDDKIRHDIDSDDVRTVCPDLPSDADQRNEYVAMCDQAAFEKIRERFPELRPPSDSRQPAPPKAKPGRLTSMMRWCR